MNNYCYRLTHYLAHRELIFVEKQLIVCKSPRNCPHLWGGSHQSDITTLDSKSEDKRRHHGSGSCTFSLAPLFTTNWLFITKQKVTALCTQETFLNRWPGPQSRLWIQGNWWPCVPVLPWSGESTTGECKPGWTCKQDGGPASQGGVWRHPPSQRTGKAQVVTDQPPGCTGCIWRDPFVSNSAQISK